MYWCIYTSNDRQTKYSDQNCIMLKMIAINDHLGLVLSVKQHEFSRATVPTTITLTQCLFVISYHNRNLIAMLYCLITTIQDCRNDLCGLWQTRVLSSIWISPPDFGTDRPGYYILYGYPHLNWALANQGTIFYMDIPTWFEIRHLIQSYWNEFIREQQRNKAVTLVCRISSEIQLLY